jgi:16S rRNA (cytosine967-C5)-methyltransferase
MYVQDAAARLSVLCAQLPEHARVLDCCGAPGGKSFAASVAMHGTGHITACDIHNHKTELIRNGARRLGLNNITVVEQDATQLRKEWVGQMDAVIADVPCSGLGIIRKKPDIRYKDLHQMKQLPQLQLQILGSVAQYVKPGGTLMYSTCTLVYEENEGLVKKFLSAHPEFTVQPLDLPPVFPQNETGMLALIPPEFDTDGFFICKMRRKV